MVVARAALEACVNSLWLNDPAVDTDERIKRALCEMLYSTREVKRLELALDHRSAKQEATWLRIAAAFGWQVSNQIKPTIDGTRRPSVSDGIAAMMSGVAGAVVGKVQWSFLSAVVHGTWYGLVPSFIEAPGSPSGLGPSIGMVGTEGKAVNAQSLCLLRALRIAGTQRLTLMGYLDDVWTDACRQSEAHELELLRSLAPTGSV
jgi:hypothetical protein